MEECDICLTKIKKRNKNKQEQSKKHKYFSNLIKDKYIIKNDETDKFKDIIQPYYDKHKKKLDDFTVRVVWKKDDVTKTKISVPSVIKMRRTYLFELSLVELPIMLKIPEYDYLDQYNKECVNDKVDEIVKLFISDLGDITFFHYMDQPLCRKRTRKFPEEDFGDFDYNWLPNCFRHINTQLYFK